MQTKCPYDRQNIDPNSLTSRTEKVMRMLKAPLENTAYATAIGGMVGGCVAIITARGVGRAAGLGGLAGRGPAGVAGGLILGDCIKRILERRDVDVSVRVIIGYGIFAGGLATDRLA